MLIPQTNQSKNIMTETVGIQTPITSKNIDQKFRIEVNSPNENHNEEMFFQKQVNDEQNQVKEDLINNGEDSDLLLTRSLSSKAVPAQSYKTVDMKLLGLRGNLTKASDQEIKNEEVEIFREEFPGFFFYRIKPSKLGLETSAHTIDEQVRTLCDKLIIADAAIDPVDGYTYLTGGLYLGKIEDMNCLDKPIFKVIKKDLLNPANQNLFVKALNIVMKAKVALV